MTNRFLLISHLLSYPTPELIEELTPNSNLTKWMKEEDIYVVQEHYVEVFDRKAKCSLYLFEHVHGDSRQRGQAMTSLKEMYDKEGFNLISTELPDYLPVFLEFLSVVSDEKANALLEEISHILLRIAKNLEVFQSPYYELIHSLVIGNPKLLEDKRVEEDLDEAWKEKPVDFSCPVSCSSSCSNLRG